MARDIKLKNISIKRESEASNCFTGRIIFDNGYSITVYSQEIERDSNLKYFGYYYDHHDPRNTFEVKIFKGLAFDNHPLIDKKGWESGYLKFQSVDQVDALMAEIESWEP